MTNRKFNVRMWGFVLLTLVLFSTLGWTLYSAQIIYGQSYQEQSQRKQGETQTVEVARGSILDRYGRVLVSNDVSYQVTFDWKNLGDTQTRNNSIAGLIRLAKEENHSWNDSLGITAEAPYYYTGENIFYGTYQNDEGQDYRVLSRLGELAVKMKWIDDPIKGDIPYLSAVDLMEKMATTFQLEDYEGVSQREIIGVLYDLYLRYYAIRHDDYAFVEEIDIVFTTKIKEHNFSGVAVEATTSRVYGTEYAAHLLGRVSSMSAEEWDYYKTLDVGYAMNDVVGKEGAEQAFESYLRGVDGVQEIERNLQGDIMASQWLVEPEPGNNVILTLDIDLQKRVEDILAEEVPRIDMDGIQGAAAVLTEVNTGAVLAAGSYPTFDLSLYAEEIEENLANPLNPLYNRAFMGTYAPGSTFKMITGMAALEEGIAGPYTTYRCDHTFDYYEDNGPACWIYNQFLGTHGQQNISDAIKNSCNYYFYEVMVELGIENLGRYANMFGIGEPSGIELQERVGVMAGPDYTEALGGIWYNGAGLSASIGQESTVVTPLQLSNYTATLVNGGTRYSAHLLQEVKSGDYSQVLERYDPQANSQNLDIEAVNMEAVKTGMKDLVNTGSVSAEFYTLGNMGIQVGAKTGTAQLTDESSASANAVFVCFAPYDNPEVSLTIVVEKGGSGNHVATIAAEILEYYFTNKENRDVIQKEDSFVP